MVWFGLAGSVDDTRVAVPVLKLADPTAVLSLLKVTVPVAVFVREFVTNTEALRVTAVPAIAWFMGLIVRAVVVGVAGAGGRGSVPSNDSDIALIFPAKRAFTSVVAGAQLVVSVTFGIVKSLSASVADRVA